MAKHQHLNRRAFLALSGAAAASVPATAWADELTDADTSDQSDGTGAEEGADDPLAELSENPVTQQTGLAALVVCDPAVALGDTEHVVVIGDDSFGTLAGGAVVVENFDTQVVQTLEAQDVVDNAALMTLDYTSEDELGSWGVTKVVMYWEGGSVTEHTVSADEASQHFVFAAAAAEKEEGENSTAQDPAYVASDEEGVDAVTYDSLGEAADASDVAVENADSQVDYLSGSVRMVPMALATADDGAMTQAANAMTCIAIDPGHGGWDTGAPGNGLQERDLTWKISQYCVAKLKELGIPTYVTVTESEFTNESIDAIAIKERVTRAVNNNAKAVISMHINFGGGTGVEVWVPQNVSFNSNTNVEGTAVGNKILEKLSALGLKNRGIKTKSCEQDEYSDGKSLADWYGIIRYARENGITGIIVEHGFIDNATDAAFFAVESNLKKLGEADAEAIAAQWPELKTSTTTTTPIMGTSSTNREGIATWFASQVPDSRVAACKDAGGITAAKDFGYAIWDQASLEGVRPEVLMAQVIVETGWLKFGGQVKPTQCNFGGIGATDGGAAAATFANIKTGLLAQAQHLKAYACRDACTQTCVDPRFNLVTRGSAPNVEDLGNGKWATDPDYASKLLTQISAILAGAGPADANTYATIADGTLCTIVSALDTGKVLDVASGSDDNRANIQLYQSNGTLAQRFRIVANGDGTYRIVNCKSGKVLDVASGSTANKTNVQQYTWNGTNAQRWKFVAQGAGYRIVSALDPTKALDVASGSTANRTNIQLYQSNGTTAQTFVLKTLSQPLANGTYRVATALSPVAVLDVASGSTANKANIQIYTRNDTDAQSFKLEYQKETGCYRIVNVNSGKVLDVQSGSSASGTNVQQYTWNGTVAQLWTLEKQSDGSYVVRSATGSCVLDLAGAKTLNRTNVQVYKDNGTTAQHWNFAKLS